MTLPNRRLLLVLPDADRYADVRRAEAPAFDVFLLSCCTTDEKRLNRKSLVNDTARDGAVPGFAYTLRQVMSAGLLKRVC